jgi:hypothetical protein
MSAPSAVTNAGKVATNSAAESSSVIPLILMAGSGLGFLIYYCYLIFQGIPSSRTEVYFSRNSRIYQSLVPVILVPMLFTVGAAWWVFTTRSQFKLLPIILTPFISLVFSILAMYFSQFQVTIAT